MIHIETKLRRGIFFCYATIYGYDYSFAADTMSEAQGEMRKLLDRKNITDIIEWYSLKVIEDFKVEKLPPAPIKYAKSRIDNL